MSASLQIVNKINSDLGDNVAEIWLSLATQNAFNVSKKEHVIVF